MKKLLFIALSVVFCGSAMAQLKITGRVTDQLGCPLKGAIVQVEGKENLKTTTDKNGEYTITVPKNSTHLIYDYPNMNKTMVEIQGRSKINVSLTLVSHLQEVFYGTKDNSKILYLVDGKVVSKELFDQIPQTEIKDVNVMKGISSAVVVNTKSGLKTNGVVTAVRGVKKSNDMVNPITTQVTDANNKIQALVVVKDAEGKIYKVNEINSIEVNSIKSMTVFKSSPAKDEFKKYGDTSNGVIYIELKDKIDETKK